MKVANVLSQEIKTPFTQPLPIIFSSGTWPPAHVDATFNSDSHYVHQGLPARVGHTSQQASQSQPRVFSPDTVYI